MTNRAKLPLEHFIQLILCANATKYNYHSNYTLAEKVGAFVIFMVRENKVRMTDYL